MVEITSRVLLAKHVVFPSGSIVELKHTVVRRVVRSGGIVETISVKVVDSVVVVRTS